jgi:putative transposase
MLRSHRIALDPNNTQATYFARACGTARFAYNWALGEWKQRYEGGEKPSEAGLRRELNARKREEFPWMLEVTKCAPQMAIIHLGDAFKRFFAGQAKYPQFKKKGQHDSFTITNDQFRVEGSRIRIPNLGWVRMREDLRFVGKIVSATISRTAHRWFVSITVETPETHATVCENQATVGVDLGVETMATLSTGEKVEGTKPHKRLLKRLKRLSRSLSRKVKGSRNREKAKRKIARLHARIAQIRSDAMHKLTTNLANQFGTVVVEDLNTKGMSASASGTIENPGKNVKAKSGLNRSILDQGFYEFRRQLDYKMEERGGVLVVADRWFASSKTCSSCGHKCDLLPLSVREWSCPACGALHDRDVNAAKNLANLAVSSTVIACGEGRLWRAGQPARETTLSEAGR